MDWLTSRILLQKVCSYEWQFCTKVCASSSLVSQVYMMAGQNIKKKYLMCQNPIKTLKQHTIPNSSLHNLHKIYLPKGCRKTSQGWMIINDDYRWMMNDYTYMYLANIVILNIRIFNRKYHFRLWVFASPGVCFYYWNRRVLPNVWQRKWCQGLMYIIFYACSQIIIYMYIADWLV